jgi:hypothetical protein
LLLGAAAAVPAWGQKSSLFSGSFNPTQITNKPIDTTKNLSAPLPPQPEKPTFFSKVTSLFSSAPKSGKYGAPYSSGPTQDMFQPPLPLKAAPGTPGGK